MNKETRNAIERATQRARILLEDDFGSQLEGSFDILVTGAIAPSGGIHLTASALVQRDKIVAAIERKRVGMNAAGAVQDYLRDAAFTAVNRFVALKMLEARGLVQECITKGDQSSGYKEYCGLAPGVGLLPDGFGYRLYIECLFDELSAEVKVLFDRRDPASVLWPRRSTIDALLAELNAADLTSVWSEDETIGWVYQFFNSGDERKRMREQSQAPRNGHELAVRNQFFTPRYVVQFLVDNTLGRTWLEMHGANSRLTELCQYFITTESDATHMRARKDPRDLRVLDPACGSGHFLIYAFDLLLTIYEEAWTIEGAQVKSDATGRTLRQDYPDVGSLRLAAPALVLEHNLYGVDIDARAAQIAALALWLRAQRAWSALRVPAGERPRVRRTHVVIAEPMPENAALVAAFAAGLEPPLLRELFGRMVAEMRLAGELGSLAPVERRIAEDVHRARDEFAKRGDTVGYLPGLGPARKQGELDFSGITDDGFLREAEARIVEALRNFAEAAAGGAGVRRRLFADDAGQGIALIDLLRTRFDVVLMNPPFGAGSLAAKKDFEKAYPRTKNDVYAAFVERGVQLLHEHGLLGAITSRTGFFLSSYQKWREEILLAEAPPIVFADLGNGVMDAAMVEAAAYCLERGREPGGLTVFLRLLEAPDKAASLLTAVREPEKACGGRRFEVSAQSFSEVPRSPFSYWVSSRLRGLFHQHPSLSELFLAVRGAYTTDDFRYYRLAWEVAPSLVARSRDDTLSGKRFVRLAKGGAFSPFYADLHLVIAWGDDGAEAKAFLAAYRERKGWGTDWTACLNGYDHYFRPGLTWPLRTNGLSLRVMPAGCIFSHKGPAVFAKRDDPDDLLGLASLTNSQPFAALVSLQLARTELAQSYEVGLMQGTPVPRLQAAARKDPALLARRAWSLRRALDTRIETAQTFTLPGLLQATGSELASCAQGWSERLSSIRSSLTTIQSEIDERSLALYGIQDTDLRAVTVDSELNAASVATTSETSSDEDPSTEDAEGDESDEGADPGSLAAELVSWAVGVAFGRFDVRFATRARPLPTEPDPFDPLPPCSPGMLAGADGLPLQRPPKGYPVSFPETGVLVDDVGHTLDLISAVRAVFDVVFRAQADRWWQDVGALLDPKGHDLRTWLAESFFDFHIRRYSKSRRKAPIYWQVSTSSRRYSVWLYSHRLERDSLLHIQNDIVATKLTHEERKLSELSQSSGGNPSARDRKSIAAQEAFVGELRELLADVKRVAPLVSPDLSDGVALVSAPLWRLVPQHKGWQKELRSKWDELCTGEHDWAHLAMYLWPERVVPKCATDRSLAIAHGLEDVFWAHDEEEGWRPRPLPSRPIRELVDERTSHAVKATLGELLASSAPNGAPARKSKKGRSS